MKFGEPFNPKSVEGHHAALAERREQKRTKQVLEDLSQEQADTRPLRTKFWDWLRRR